MGTMDTLLHPMEDPFHQIGMENNKDQEDASDLEDHLESLTKALSGNRFNKDRIHCFQCKEFDHMQKDCPELNKPPQEEFTGPV